MSDHLVAWPRFQQLWVAPFLYFILPIDDAVSLLGWLYSEPKLFLGSPPPRSCNIQHSGVSIAQEVCIGYLYYTLFGLRDVLETWCQPLQHFNFTSYMPTKFLQCGWCQVETPPLNHRCVTLCLTLKRYLSRQQFSYRYLKSSIISGAIISSDNLELLKSEWELALILFWYPRAEFLISH